MTAVAMLPRALNVCPLGKRYTFVHSSGQAANSSNYLEAGPAVTGFALNELTELGSRIEGEFSLGSACLGRAV